MTATITKPILAKEIAVTAARFNAPKSLYVVQAFFYTAFCLAALEVLFSLAHVGESEYIKPDLSVGYKPMEGKTITQRREGFGTFTFNSFGMQNDEIPLAKAPGTLRIAVLGDSYVESIQVDRKQNYCSLLAADLSSRLKRKVEVLNFGVANYSIAQDYLRYQQLAKSFAPDLVLLGFRVEEVVKLLPEPTTKLMSVRPVFFPGADGKLLYDNLCVRNFFSSPEGKRINKTYWLRRYSHTWGVIGTLVQNLMGATAPVADQSPGAPKAPVVSDAANIASAQVNEKANQEARARYTNCYWYLMDAQLKAFAQACQGNHAPMLILRTPSGNVNETETALLHQTATRLGIDVLNLDKQYKEQFTAADAEKHFLGHGHFTAAMHQWVENQIAHYLIAEKPQLLPALLQTEDKKISPAYLQSLKQIDTQTKELKASALQ